MRLRSSVQRVAANRFAFVLHLVWLLAGVRLAADKIWQESFETNGLPSGWTITGGTWEVGVPTTGPSTNALGRRAHSGTNVAATVLRGNYAEGVDSRLVSPAFMVPAADQNPRRRFWQWFGFNSGDYGEVQIKTRVGDWQPMSRHEGPGAVWSPEVLDLSAYAGQTVQVGSLLHSRGVNCCDYDGTAAGWYLDEVTLVTGPIQTLAPNVADGFEGGWGDWSSDNGTGEVVRPTSGPGGAHRGTNVAATVLGGNYVERSGDYKGAGSRLVSPVFTDNPAPWPA